MNIGILAFGFSLVCGAVVLIGSTAPEKDRPRQTADYNNIYQALSPEEL